MGNVYSISADSFQDGNEVYCDCPDSSVYGGRNGRRWG